MFCQNCGTKNSDNSAFCANCGTALSAPVQQPAQQPVQQPVYAAPVQQPMQQPVYAAPAQQPMPTQQPVYAAPMQQPYGMPMQQPVYGAPTKKKMGKGAWIAIIASIVAVLAAAAVLLIVLLGGGGKDTPEAVAEQVAMALMEFDFDGLADAVPEAALEQWAEECGFRSFSKMKKTVPAAGDEEREALLEDLGSDDYDVSCEITSSKKLKSSELADLQERYEDDLDLEVTAAYKVDVKIVVEGSNAKLNKKQPSRSTTVYVVEIDGTWYLDIYHNLNIEASAAAGADDDNGDDNDSGDAGDYNAGDFDMSDIIGGAIDFGDAEATVVAPAATEMYPVATEGPVATEMYPIATEGPVATEMYPVATEMYPVFTEAPATEPPRPATEEIPEARPTYNSPEEIGQIIAYSLESCDFRPLYDSIPWEVQEYIAYDNGFYDMWDWQMAAQEDSLAFKMEMEAAGYHETYYWTNIYGAYDMIEIIRAYYLELFGLHVEDVQAVELDRWVECSDYSDYSTVSYYAVAIDGVWYVDGLYMFCPLY